MNAALATEPLLDPFGKNVPNIEDGRVGFWADKAMEMGRHTLEQYVRDYRNTFRTGPKFQSDEIDESAQIMFDSTISDGSGRSEALRLDLGTDIVSAWPIFSDSTHVSAGLTLADVTFVRVELE